MTDGSREGDILLVTMLLLSYGKPRRTNLWTRKVQELGRGVALSSDSDWSIDAEKTLILFVSNRWLRCGSSYGKLWDTWGLATGHVDKETFENIGQIQRACVPASTLRVSASLRNGWDSTVVLNKKGEGHSFGPGMILFVCFTFKIISTNPASLSPAKQWRYENGDGCRLMQMAPNKWKIRKKVGPLPVFGVNLPTSTTEEKESGSGENKNRF